MSKPTPDTEKLAEAKKQLRVSYQTIFNSEHGRRVLDDLKRKCGFGPSGIENPSAVIGSRPEDVFLREGMKEPIRHILAWLEKVDEQPKPTEAITTQ
jgi:hypothetical protein